MMDQSNFQKYFGFSFDPLHYFRFWCRLKIALWRKSNSHLKWIKIAIPVWVYQHLSLPKSNHFRKIVLFIRNWNQKWILPQDYTLKRKKAPCFKLNELLEHLEHFDNFEYFRILLRTWFWFRSMTVKIFNW